jgi:hypothetical protein
MMHDGDRSDVASLVSFHPSRARYNPGRRSVALLARLLLGRVHGCDVAASAQWYGTGWAVATALGVDLALRASGDGARLSSHTSTCNLTKRVPLRWQQHASPSGYPLDPWSSASPHCWDGAHGESRNVRRVSHLPCGRSPAASIPLRRTATRTPGCRTATWWRLRCAPAAPFILYTRHAGHVGCTAGRAGLEAVYRVGRAERARREWGVCRPTGCRMRWPCPRYVSRSLPPCAATPLCASHSAEAGSEAGCAHTPGLGGVRVRAHTCGGGHVHRRPVHPPGGAQTRSLVGLSLHGSGRPTAAGTQTRAVQAVPVQPQLWYLRTVGDGR